MRVKSVREVNVENTKVYDVIDVKPYHNFEINTNTNRHIISANSVLERMGSRFMIDGKIAGCLFVVSSKKSEHDFIEQYVQKKKNDPHMFVVDSPLWMVKPSGTYSGKTFKVAVGGSNMVSKIIQDDEDPQSYIRQGYSIIEPPLEFKGRFEMDLNAALMNIAGISVSNVTKFITYTNLEKCYTGDRKNPFMSNIISIGLYDDHTIKEFFLPSLIPEEIYSRPIFIHLDMSVTGDRTGISAVAAMGKRYMDEYNLETNQMDRVQKMVYYHVFSIGIQCPAGSEISLQKNRDFIYYLRNELGWNIKSVSTDGFQSVDTRQSLINSGIDAKLVSLDRTPDGYLSFKAAINEKRISMLEIPELETEIINLERDNMSGKVDHPIDGCFTNDTKIRLADGRDLSIEGLLIEQKYKNNYVYTINEETGAVEIKRIKKVFKTKTVSKLLKVTLDNGEIIKCTPEHRFMLEDGSYEEIRDINNGEAMKSVCEDGINTSIIRLSNLEKITKICNVYDLEIEDNHNFALSAGVFVHNSKDIADSVSGALYNAFLNESNMGLEIIDDASHIIDVNKDAIEDDDRISILQNIVSQVKGMRSDPLSNVAIEEVPEKKSPISSRIEDMKDFNDGILMF